MALLSVNVDHVATVRQARRGIEPDPVRAAHDAEIGGADGITVHLREDRRHIQDHDVDRLKATVATKLNFEMAATDDMVRIALRIRPDMAMLVPEGRLEVTTEGGLQVAGHEPRLREIVARLRDGGVPVSAFVDPEADHIEAAAQCGFSVCEVHTGPYAAAYRASGGDLRAEPLARELDRVRAAGELIERRGMRFNAGHALNYVNVAPIASLPGLWELHIGHAIVSRAIYTGMRDAVREMKAILTRAHGSG
ncbi:MAG: pyridoxine 5'-phosphate synthase [Phycisphaeraceae bacterium]|nr:pyridoxine 5'-phosphate synthase [Phycisphaeraceae bacterium]